MVRLGLLMILVQMVMLHQILGMLRLVLAQLIRHQMLVRLVQVLCLRDKLRHPQTHSRTVQLGPYRYLSAEAQELLVLGLGMLRQLLEMLHLGSGLGLPALLRLYFLRRPRRRRRLVSGTLRLRLGQDHLAPLRMIRH